MKVSTRSLFEIALFTGLTAVGGLIRIPLPLVPLTMQTFFVYLSGILLGCKKGAISQIVFLCIGLLGVPIFGQGGGLMYVLQPSFGYLLAFPIASWVVGKINGEAFIESEWKRIAFSFAMGILSILLIGTLGLWFNMKFITHVPIYISKAVVGGFLIFLPGEILKGVGVYFLMKKLKRLQTLMV